MNGQCNDFHYFLLREVIVDFCSIAWVSRRNLDDVLRFIDNCKTPKVTVSVNPCTPKTVVWGT
jgi:hypothetical protein